MRVAVAGGSGLIGGHVVQALKDSGHDPVVVSRSAGANAATGEGLREALADAEVVVDVTNTASLDRAEAAGFFASVTRNLLEAEAELGIGHHVLLSIVGVDRVKNNPHYAAKLVQEEVAESAGTALSILRATQFFEFAEMVLSWTGDGRSATIPPLLMQPVAAAEVGTELAQIAVGEPLNTTVEVAGPRREDLVDMTRRILTARGERVELRPAWHVGPFDTDMAGDVLLPSESARTTAMDLEAWLL